MTIEKFKEAINSLAIATPNRYVIYVVPTNDSGIVGNFNVAMDKHNLGTTTLYCSDVSVPSTNIMTASVIRDHAHFEVPYGISYEPVRMTFMVDRDHDIKNAFRSWIDAIHMRTGDNDSRTSGLRFKDDYTATVFISVLNKADEATMTYLLHNAYPKSVSGYQLSSMDTGSPLSIVVEFTYDNFTQIQGGDPSLSDSFDSGKVPSNIPPTNSQTSGTEQSIESSGSFVLDANKNVQYIIDSAPNVSSIDDIAPGTTLRSRVDESLGIVVSNATTLLDGVPNKINELGDFINEPVNIFKSEVKKVNEIVKSRSNPFKIFRE